jgi:hypothetical protein
MDLGLGQPDEDGGRGDDDDSEAHAQVGADVVVSV